MKILDGMCNWSEIVRQLTSAMAAISRPNSPAPLLATNSASNVMEVPPDASKEVRMLQHTVQVLSRALKEDLRSKVNSMKSNVELLAFAVTWFAQVSICPPLSSLPVSQCLVGQL